MNIVFIARIGKEDDPSNSGKLNELLAEFEKITDHEVKAYIIAGFGKKYSNSFKFPVEIIESKDPTSSVSINSVFSKIEDYNPDAFLICSKEVGLKKESIETLIKEINDNPCLLVVGYKFEIFDDKKLNDELCGYYENKNLIAYRVPWNTCAIWNYGLFKEYIKKFDEITLGKYPFGNIGVSIDGIGQITQHKGMEDGLAIARAVSQSKEIRFKLLEEKLKWEVKRTEDHRKKLARKDYVMRNFMAMRGYSVADLEFAEIK